MPKLLSQFLKRYPKDQADALYLFLDGNPDAIEKMKEVLAESHPTLPVLRQAGGKLKGLM